MRKLLKLSVLVSCFMFAFGFTSIAYENSDRPIEEVSITVSGVIPSGTTYNDTRIQITVPDNAKYYFSGMTVMNEGDHWETGDVPDIKLSFMAISGNYFRITKASQIILNGNGIKYVSAARQDQGYRLEVEIKMPPCAEADPSLSGGWDRDGDYWIYRYSDGSLASGWQEIDGEWYYFQQDYRMAVNQWLENGTYYVGEDGRMLKNTHTPDGYWVDASGRYRNDASASGLFNGYQNSVSGEFSDHLDYSVFYNYSYKDPNTGAVFYIDSIQPSPSGHSFLLSYHTDSTETEFPLNYVAIYSSRHTPTYSNVKNNTKRNEKIRFAQRNGIYEYEHREQSFSVNLSYINQTTEIKTDLGGATNAYKYTVYIGSFYQGE